MSESTEDISKTERLYDVVTAASATPVVLPSWKDQAKNLPTLCLVALHHDLHIFLQGLEGDPTWIRLLKLCKLFVKRLLADGEKHDVDTSSVEKHFHQRAIPSLPALMSAG